MGYERLVHITDYIRTNIQPDINIQQLDILFRVAANPGITQSELMGETGLMTGSVSRHLAKLSKYKHHTTGKITGLGLIMQTPNPHNRKQLSSWLTKEGTHHVKELLKLWENTSS